MKLCDEDILTLFILNVKKKRTVHNYGSYYLIVKKGKNMFKFINKMPNWLYMTCIFLIITLVLGLGLSVFSTPSVNVGINDGLGVKPIIPNDNPNKPDVVIPDPDTPSEETYILSGTYRFNSVINTADFKGVIFTAQFTSNNTIYTEIHLDRGMSYSGDTTVEVYPYESGIGYTGWINEAYRTITFDGEQMVSKEFYDWFTANAVLEYTLSGIWRFDEEVYCSEKDGTGDFEADCLFTCNGVLYKGFDMSHGYFHYIQQSNGQSITVTTPLNGIDEESTFKEEYRIINFVEPYLREDIPYAYHFIIGSAAFAFTVEGTTYYAKTDMTWAEWVQSEYNTSDFVIDSYNNVYSPSGNVNIAYERGGVGPEAGDVIKADFSYALTK